MGLPHLLLRFVVSGVVFSPLQVCRDRDSSPTIARPLHTWRDVTVLFILLQPLYAIFLLLNTPHMPFLPILCFPFGCVDLLLCDHTGFPTMACLAFSIYACLCLLCACVLCVHSPCLLPAVCCVQAPDLASIVQLCLPDLLPANTLPLCLVAFVACHPIPIYYCYCHHSMMPAFAFGWPDTLLLHTTLLPSQPTLYFYQHFGHSRWTDIWLFILPPCFWQLVYSGPLCFCLYVPFSAVYHLQTFVATAVSHTGTFCW